MNKSILDQSLKWELTTTKRRTREIHDLLNSYVLMIFGSGVKSDLIWSWSLIWIGLGTDLDLFDPIFDLRSQIWDFRSEISDLQSKIWDLRSEIWDLRFQIWDLRSEIADLRSQIWDLKSEILDHMLPDYRFYATSPCEAWVSSRFLGRLKSDEIWFLLKRHFWTS